MLCYIEEVLDGAINLCFRASPLLLFTSHLSFMLKFEKRLALYCGSSQHGCLHDVLDCDHRAA
jgi:hypothetical protein